MAKYVITLRLTRRAEIDVDNTHWGVNHGEIAR